MLVDIAQHLRGSETRKIARVPTNNLRACTCAKNSHVTRLNQSKVRINSWRGRASTFPPATYKRDVIAQES